MESQMSANAKAMIEELRQDAEPLVAALMEITGSINMLEGRASAPLTTIYEIVAHFVGDEQPTAEKSGSPRPSIGGPQRRAAIRADQYLGQPPLTAAKAYLGLVGAAAPFEEIAQAVQQGNAAIKGSNWREDLEMSLIRSTAEIVKVNDGVFGLVRFYTPEQIKALRDARKPTPAPKKARGKRKRRIAAKGAAPEKGRGAAKPTADAQLKLADAKRGEEVTLQ